MNEMTISWNEKSMPTILSNYKLKGVFNADEFGKSALEGRKAE